MNYVYRIVSFAALSMLIVACDMSDNNISTNSKKNEKFEALSELYTLKSWFSVSPRTDTSDLLINLRHDLLSKIDAAVKHPTFASARALRREFLSLTSLEQGADGSIALSATHSLEKVFIDEPYRGKFSKCLEIGLAKNETEGTQLLVHSAGKPLRNVVVRLDDRLRNRYDSRYFIKESSVRIRIVGYVDTSVGDRPYISSKKGWWPDPLIPNHPFDVSSDEVLPLLISVTTTDLDAAGVYDGKISVTVDNTVRAEIPLSVTVYDFALPKRGHFSTLALGCSLETIDDYYGSISSREIIDRFAIEALRNRMPMVELLNGWGWQAPKIPKGVNGDYNFQILDHYLDIFKEGGVTCFPMAIVPRFRRFGGGDYSEQFKKEFITFVKSYATYLKQRGMFDVAVLYNIDEASNAREMREWGICKEIYTRVKQEVPDLPVLQCINEHKAVRSLKGYVDIWDIYIRQFEQADAARLLKSGDKLMLSVCIWPSERPNLFIEYPLIDARIMPWIAFRVGATGFEYWEMFASWKNNLGNKSWWRNPRTSWKLAKPHGDGLLIYPGPAGEPISSLRLESLRDGIEDYEYLVLLSQQHNPEAIELLEKAKNSLVSGIVTYESDPNAILQLRKQIALAIEKANIQ